jgi:hypothetical protein
VNRVIHDMEPPPEVLAPGERESVALATVLLAVVCALAWLVFPLLFVPWLAARWVRAIRGVPHGPGRGSRAGLVFLATSFAPLATGLAHGTGSGPVRVLAPLGMALVLTPFLLRLPVVLVDLEGGRASFGEALRRAQTLAGTDVLRTVVLTVLHVAATLAVLGLGAALWQLGALDGLPMVSVTLGAFPLAWTPVMMLASRWTPVDAPRASVRGLAAIAALLLPGIAAIGAIALLATNEPLPLEVLSEGRGIQPVPGMMRELGERGHLEQPGFALRSAGWSERSSGRALVVVPREGEPYEIAAAHDPATAVMISRPCDGGGPDCVEIRLRGPDWEMRVHLDAAGRRLDDGRLDRSLARLGVAGTTALAVGTFGVLVTWLVLSRATRRARLLGGAGYRHRLVGKLRLGEHGALEGGALVGPSNRVELLDGSVVLRLPERLEPLAIEARLRHALHGAEVRVSLNEALATGTHRNADTPWPAAARLVIGSPAAIESEALEGAAVTITRLMTLGILATAAALAVVGAG